MNKHWKGLVLVLVFCMSLVPKGFANEKEGETNSITVLEVINFLKEKTGKNFFFSNTEIDTSQKVKIDLKKKSNTSLDILKEMGEQINVDYEIREKIIVLKPTYKDRNDLAIISRVDQQGDKRVISGIVKDETGQSVISATISYTHNGSVYGAITDNEGMFVITLPADVESIKINFIGYKEEIIQLGEKDYYAVNLKLDNQDIGEVVATGFRNVDRREFTGSVVKIKMDDIQQQGIETVDKMLQGQVAGVQVENVSGTSGSRSKIRIRGNSSISGNREPLWVVDGVVMEDVVSINPNELYSGDPTTLVSSAIGGVNPNDIESIDILKDASATALYGTQAVNGVIVITTKRGKKGQFNIDYSGNFTTELKPQVTDFYMMNSAERIDLSMEMFDKGLISYNHLDYYAGGFGMAVKALNDKTIDQEEFQREVYRLKKANTDWFDLLFKNSFKMDHNLSVSSGNEKAQYFFSMNYLKDYGNTIGQGTDRYIANFRANYNINDKLTFGVKLNLSNKEQKIYNTGVNPYVYALTTSRAIPEKNADGSDYYYTYSKTDMNVFNEIDNSFSNLSSLDALCQLDVQWEILKGLKLNSIVSYRKAFTHVERIYTENSNAANRYREDDRYFYDDPLNNDATEGVTILPRGGLMQTDDNRSTFFTNRNFLNWSKTFNNHKVDVMAGEEYRSKIYDYAYTFGYGYEYYRGRSANPSYLPMMQAEEYGSDPYYGLNTKPSYTLSYFGTASYTYKGKYTLTGNMRSDGSNQFGQAARYRFLPIWSVGANWNLSNEAFMKNNSTFSNLALRASYGMRGNVSGYYSPQVLAYYDLSYAMNAEDREEVLYVVQPPNPDLQWEKEHIYNVALDFAFKGGLRGSLEYYNRSNYDLISPYPVSYVTGFKNVNMNWASMRNQGVEVALNMDLIKSSNFRWNTNFTFGYNHNEILEAFYRPTLQTLASETIAAPVEGKPLTGIYAFKFAGLDHEGIPTFYNANDEVVYGMDLTDRDISALEYMGSKEPVYSGGLTNTINFKNINLSFLLVYSGGNKTRLDDVYSYYYSDDDNVSKEMVNRWQLPGDEEYTNVPAILDLSKQYELQIAGYDTPYMYNNSNIRVVDGSYLKLRNVTLGYSLKSDVHKIKGVGNLQFQVQGQNLWTWAHKDLNGRDPEAMIEGSNIPLLTSYTFTVKASF